MTRSEGTIDFDSLPLMEDRSKVYPSHGCSIEGYRDGRLDESTSHRD